MNRLFLLRATESFNCEVILNFLFIQIISFQLYFTKKTAFELSNMLACMVYLYALSFVCSVKTTVLLVDISFYFDKFYCNWF